jgi:hypothetical protein
MSDQPTGITRPAIDHAPEPPIVAPGSGWFQRLSSVLFIIFCFELGLFLLVYPWTNGWSDNYFAWAIRGSVQTSWHSFWDNSYVRGCISGMGLVNLWIALAEVFRMFGRRHRAGN